MRINKLLSNFGICSRKESNRIIEEDRITVNGKTCIKGQWVEETDIITLDGKIIKPKEKVYLVLNKPVGITCTASKDVKNNIIEFLNYPEYVFPVGRLDKESQGLILMTNDGDLANEILNSENKHEKEYIVTLDKSFDEEFLKRMSQGIEILKVKTRPCKITRIDENTFKIILTQGLNKQIRRMSKALGYNVIKLNRIRIMNLKIDELEIGKWRILSEKDVNKLKEC